MNARGRPALGRFHVDLMPTRTAIWLGKLELLRLHLTVAISSSDNEWDGGARRKINRELPTHPGVLPSRGLKETCREPGPSLVGAERHCANTTVASVGHARDSLRPCGKGGAARWHVYPCHCLDDAVLIPIALLVPAEKLLADWTDCREPLRVLHTVTPWHQ